MDRSGIFQSLKIPIAFCGIKHSGKSTLGGRLSQILSVPFADTDELLLKEYNERHSSPFSSFRDLYREKGKDVFVEYEYLGLSNYLDNIEMPGVIASGGGISDNDRAMALLRERTFPVYLVVPFDTLCTRVMSHGTPPFLDQENPRDHFLKIYNHRDSLYKAVSRIVVEIGNESIEDATNIVYDALKEAPDVWQ